MHNFIDKLQPKVAIFLIGINEVGVSAPGSSTPAWAPRSIPLPGQVSGGHGLPQRSGLDGLEPVSYYFPKSVQAIGERDMGEQLTTLPHMQVSEAQRAALLKTHAEKYVPAYEARLRRLLTITEDHHIIPVLLTQPVV